MLNEETIENGPINEELVVYTQTVACHILKVLKPSKEVTCLLVSKRSWQTPGRC